MASRHSGQETVGWLMRGTPVGSAAGRSPVSSSSTMARRLGVGEGLDGGGDELLRYQIIAVWL